jgi:hypothetical protein
VGKEIKSSRELLRNTNDGDDFSGDEVGKCVRMIPKYWLQPKQISLVSPPIALPPLD